MMSERTAAAPTGQGKYRDPVEVAKRIREYLARYGKENTSSLLLYEGMQAINALTSPDPVAALACAHGTKSTHYDHVQCSLCGSVFLDGGWGIASRKWFRSLDEARFFQTNGRLPDAAVPASGESVGITAPAPSHAAAHSEPARHMVAGAAAAALTGYSYQQLFDAISAATRVTAGTEHIAISVADFRAALLAAQPAEKRCEYCDGTGDVHDATGEWRGECNCGAAQPAAPAAPAAPKCATCNDTRLVDDGEITGCGGVEFNNGPIKCVKDCPDCTATATPVCDKSVVKRLATQMGWTPPAAPLAESRQGVALSVTGDEVRAIVRAAHPGGSDHPSGPDYVMATVAHLNRRASSSRAEVERAAYAAGMMRAAEICEARSMFFSGSDDAAMFNAEGCADAIRAEIAAAEAPNAES